MAIDTKAKRASALNLFILGTVLPPPDGATSIGDRQHAAGFYSGIASGINASGARYAAVQIRKDLLATVTVRKDLGAAVTIRKDLNAEVTVHA